MWDSEVRRWVMLDRGKSGMRSSCVHKRKAFRTSVSCMTSVKWDNSMAHKTINCKEVVLHQVTTAPWSCSLSRCIETPLEWLNEWKQLTDASATSRKLCIQSVETSGENACHFNAFLPMTSLPAAPLSEMRPCLLGFVQCCSSHCSSSLFKTVCFLHCSLDITPGGICIYWV